MVSKNPPDDQALIESLRKSLKRKYGGSAVSALGSADSRAEVRSGISSQSLCLDMAIGRPGFPAGRIIEISGLESVGKTLIGLHAVAETQRLGGIAMICDAEMGLDLAFVRKIGVVPGPSVMLLQAPSLEDAFTIIERGIIEVRKKHPRRPFLVLFDSIAGCLTKDELAGNYDDKVPARHARILSPALRKLADLCAREQVALVLINQLREKIGIYGGQPDSFGGKALRFHMSVRIRIKKTDVIRSKSEDIVGISVKAQVIKNKVAEPFRSATLNFHFQHGLDKADDLWMAARKIGEIVKVEGKGGWYHVGERKLRKKQWRKYLVKTLGGWEAYRGVLEARAIERGLLLPYG